MKRRSESYVHPAETKNTFIKKNAFYFMVPDKKNFKARRRDFKILRCRSVKIELR